MPPKPPSAPASSDIAGATLGELLRANYALVVRCVTCGHTGPADLLTAYRRHGAAADVAGLAERMRCSRCDGRGGTIVSISRPTGT